MFVGNIGQDGYLGTQGVEAKLVQPMTRHLEDDVADFLRFDPAQEALQEEWIGGRHMKARIYRLPPDLGFDCGDERYFFVAQAQDVVNETAGRGLAVGPGHPDNLQILAWIPIHAGGEDGEREVVGVVHEPLGDQGAETPEGADKQTTKFLHGGHHCTIRRYCPSPGGML